MRSRGSNGPARAQHSGDPRPCEFPHAPAGGCAGWEGFSRGLGGLSLWAGGCQLCPLARSFVPLQGTTSPCLSHSRELSNKAKPELAAGNRFSITCSEQSWELPIALWQGGKAFPNKTSTEQAHPPPQGLATGQVVCFMSCWMQQLLLAPHCLDRAGPGHGTLPSMSVMQRESCPGPTTLEAKCTGIEVAAPDTLLPPIWQLLRGSRPEGS